MVPGFMSDPEKPDVVSEEELELLQALGQYQTRIFARAIKILHDETEGLAPGEWREIMAKLVEVEDIEWTRFCGEHGAPVDAMARVALCHAFPQRLPQ